MEYRRLIIALLAISVLPILWSEADAQSCLRWRSVGGSKTCLSWSTGSEVLDAISTGVGNVKDCDPDLGTCPTITGSAFGTVDRGDGLCNPNDIDADCAIQGIAFCVNPAGNARKSQGQPFTLNAFLSQTEAIDTCSRNGKCPSQVILNPDPTDVICINPNWTLLTFTAEVFNAQVLVCPGGFDNTAQCCDTMARNPSGTCAVPGVEAELAQRCTVNLTNYQPGVKLPYSCCDLDTVVNGQCPQL